MSETAKSELTDAIMQGANIVAYCPETDLPHVGLFVMQVEHRGRCHSFCLGGFTKRTIREYGYTIPLLRDIPSIEDFLPRLSDGNKRNISVSLTRKFAKDATEYLSSGTQMPLAEELVTKR